MGVRHRMGKGLGGTNGGPQMVITRGRYPPNHHRTAGSPVIRPPSRFIGVRALAEIVLSLPVSGPAGRFVAHADGVSIPLV